MNKLLDTCLTVWKAARYSFAFCFNNNKKDTIVITILLIGQTLLGYGMILLMGNLVSMIQTHIVKTKSTTLSANDFLQTQYCLPIVLFVTALFIEIVLQKYRSYVMSRQGHILRVANLLEINRFIATLDIARRKSKLFDDIEKKIDELPEGRFTRIDFVRELIDFTAAFIGFVIFGVSLITEHYGYVLILIVSSIPMVFAEFSAVNRVWKQSLEMIPHHKNRSVMQQAFNGTTSFLQGLMFNQMPTLQKQIKQNQDHVIKTMDHMRWLNLQITLGGYVFAIGGLGIVLVHSIFTTLSTGGDIGALTIIIASSRQLQSSIRNIVLQIASQWQSVKGVIMIEEEYFAMKPLIQTQNPTVPEFTTTPTIRFDSVSFSYPDTNSLVLKNISFEINAGEKIVIIGKNGSGKSSLIGLLLRHYDPTSGNIRVGNINLRNITQQVWSEHISALLQNFAVLDRKVGAEIASSRLDSEIDMEGVRQASTFAGFNTVIEDDPKGYDSQIGTEFGGREFSGGQEQRLALARARYRNTPILILDEPDAKLDPEAAKQLLENVFALKGLTVIIVTQHMARATKADKVIVLEQGEIVETGSHVELLARKGKYASMFGKDKERLGENC